MAVEHLKQTIQKFLILFQTILAYAGARLISRIQNYHINKKINCPCTYD
jgi:hypothetical protein